MYADDVAILIKDEKGSFDGESRKICRGKELKINTSKPKIIRCRKRGERKV